jgi:HEAT repeat protein
MKQTFLKGAVLAALALAACSSAAWARGQETFGNEPLNAANFNDWPGIMPVVNHPSRVYHTWVNGNEHFYYRGDAAALNDTLRKLAEAKTEVREVVLRPGPGVTHSFDRAQEIRYGWNLHLVGGIARHLTTREQGDKVWSKHPVLTIYTGGEIDLEKIEIPQGLTVVPLADLKKRTREGLKSPDKTVRGWGAGVLAALDPYDAESRDAIAGLLKDEDNWVRLNAAVTLPRFGKKAQPVLPMLREALKTDDAPLKAEVEKSIQAIEQAEDQAAAEKEHREMLDRISGFLSQRKQ